MNQNETNMLAVYDNREVRVHLFSESAKLAIISELSSEGKKKYSVPSKDIKKYKKEK